MSQSWKILVWSNFLILQMSKGRQRAETCPVTEMGPNPMSQHSPHSLERWCLISLSTYEKMNGCMKQERKQRSWGKIQGDAGKCWGHWGSEPGSGVDGDFRGSWREEVTTCYLVPILLYKWGSSGPEKEMTCPRPQGLLPPRGRSSSHRCLPSLHSYMAPL